MSTVIFLGAGASKADGAPLQGELFKKYFTLIRSNTGLITHQMELELKIFFEIMFNIDVEAVNLDLIDFPTFEEVLGILELAQARKESFREFDSQTITSNSNRLEKIRIYLIMSMAKVISDCLPSYQGQGFHEKLINGIHSSELSDISFISTNYDILIDNALAKCPSGSSQGGENVNYGIDFTNYTRENNWKRPTTHAIKLHKIHGSLNWLYCSVCNTITCTPFQKGVIELIDGHQPLFCNECESIPQPIIVPPTYFKDMTNPFINQIWAQAEQTLKKSTHIIFCGYSFPDADLHIKYLLKRIQTGSQNRNIKFSIINDFPGKCNEERDIEKKRFKRFLGQRIEYKNNSFEDFAENPSRFI